MVGNILVATRDIKATEIILEEYPAASGHHAKTKPCCMECQGPAKPDEKCENCNFPLCKSEKCQRKETHSAECAIFKTMTAQLNGMKIVCP